jgi:hypothetical protein
MSLRAGFWRSNLLSAHHIRAAEDCRAAKKQNRRLAMTINLPDIRWRNLIFIVTGKWRGSGCSGELGGDKAFFYTGSVVGQGVNTPGKKYIS